VKKQIKRGKSEALRVPSTINKTWSMVFMIDSLKGGNMFHVNDDFNREFLPIVVGFSLQT
jgi:hypothetical protein